MSNFKSDVRHKENLKALGRMGAVIVAFFVIVFVAIGLNLQTWPDFSFPWFLVVIVVGGYFVVPRARAVMKAFEDNVKD